MIHFNKSKHGDLCATVRLNSWRGARDASGPYTSSRHQESDGLVEIVLLRSNERDASPDKPCDRELEAIRFLQENEQTISDALISAVEEAYPAIRRWLQDCVPEDELAELAPLVERTEDLRRLIGLSRAFLLPSMADEPPYFGFELGCSWDSEHGLGAMFCGVEPIEIGGADVSFNEHSPIKHRILRNLANSLEGAGISPGHTPSRQQALWKHAPWVHGPTPDLGIYNNNGQLLFAIDVTDFHWEGQSRWWLHFVQYRNEPSSFTRLTICPTRAEAWVWKRKSEGKDWVPVLEAKGFDAKLNIDDLGISVPLAQLYSGISLESKPPK